MPRRHESRQDYGTPWELIRAVAARFGEVEVDLAAHAGNAKAPLWIGEGHDALSLEWPRGRILWLNPPFARIEPWAARCAEWAATNIGRGRILFLTPASVGAAWWERHVHDQARVLFLRPRIVFEGMTQPFPKDTTLSVFGAPPGYEIWRWK